jgi:hypothetical protein
MQAKGDSARDPLFVLPLQEKKFGMPNFWSYFGSGKFADKTPVAQSSN